MASEFVIHDDDDKASDGEEDDDVNATDGEEEWVMKPTKSRETIWHRYQNPENREMWFACVTLPGLWCYESEVRPQVHEDGTSCFLFHGKLQKVEDAQPCEMMAAPAPARRWLRVKCVSSVPRSSTDSGSKSGVPSITCGSGQPA